ncbi:hypothetical protein Pyn_30255 [Prunus yedoensis var. nudiflora]|uniref:Uncharacterized protein n=1 Tax=Prunus yedoensis var. nudiflora TaxID=2094558 RepID=A0A314U7E1_PRUYE|nr:hypothetical protein Pyn_30255 [Prunus yedoensis var. nudiflora]
MPKGTGCRRCQACVSQSDVARHKGSEGIMVSNTQSLHKTCVSQGKLPEHETW